MENEVKWSSEIVGMLVAGGYQQTSTGKGQLFLQLLITQEANTLSIWTGLAYNRFTYTSSRVDHLPVSSLHLVN
eukprot:scaffold31244_cov34-Prasinocladus_malaysianus.AAC.1